MSVPNFIIAGVARCGTTSLYYYLKQHPDIAFANLKEPRYFSSLDQVYPHNGPGDHTVDRSIVRDFSGYKRLFEGLGSFKCVGEASSDYLFFHQVSAEAIYNTLGDIPIILCLRNPVDRAYSAFNNLLRDQRETLQFEAALSAEERRLAENWDWMWAYKSGGLYSHQVATFMRKFSRVKIVIFDDLASEPNAVVRDLFAFLGVDDTIDVNTKTKYSHSGKAKNRLVALASNRNNVVAFTLRRLALAVLPRSVLEQIASKSLKQEVMSRETQMELKQFFQEDISTLENLIGRSLQAWR